MNEAVKIITITPTKADAEKGRWLLDSGDFYLPQGFTIAQSALVGFKPGAWAGNHRHDRQEVLLGLAGELYLIWKDADGIRHEEKMVHHDGQLRFFAITSQVPHLVENRSHAADAALYEWADGLDTPTYLEGSDSLRES